jgi:hypothetical protein
MQKHGAVRFSAIFAATAILALGACSSAPEEASDSSHDSLRGLCWQEPVSDCYRSAFPYDYLYGFVVLAANERCPSYTFNRMTFTGTGGQSFLADIPPELVPRMIPRLTPAMQSGAQPFCVYQADTLDPAPYESSFCSVSSIVDVLCAAVDPEGKPGCAKCAGAQ